MPRKISTILNVESKDLNKKGAFDGFIDIDSRLHIDPSLLEVSKIKEFKNSKKSFDKYFLEVLTIIKSSKNENDVFWKEAHRRLQFKEIGNTALGYSDEGTDGNAIGPKLALQILQTVSQIVEAGIVDPIIFELVGMFEKGVGADRISDMTVNLLFDNFALYSNRVAKELNAPLKLFNIKETDYELPFDPETGREIILVPKSLLNNLPIATDWDDIDRVCKYNDSLRRKVSKIIGKSWKSATRVSKVELKRLILQEPELLKDLITQYKSKPRSSYDFQNDPLGELIWAELSEKAPQKYPLDLNNYRPVTAENILEIVKKICEQFTNLIENNGWFEYLYDNTGKLKPERAPQLLFYGIAEVYCIANNLDLSRETNAGIGSLDFKISKGFQAKVNVELKYSTNTSLVNGFQTQLPAYNRAEKTDTSIYLIIQTKRSNKNIEALKKIADSSIRKGERVPEIMVIDGQKQQSASKRR
ncbi:MAG: hypothetical protein KBG24_12690 [Bacteroidia bacterium]|nr:hypothetical protein [Bacteroidia bacterium]MBP9181344.1 hypothetical protein [Bacteroidia bacterium]